MGRSPEIVTSRDGLTTLTGAIDLSMVNAFVPPSLQVARD
jgi:hypothetical protein